MSLTKRARELWLEGDDNPYETLSRQLEAERREREGNVVESHDIKSDDSKS